MKKVLLYQFLWLLLFPVYGLSQDSNSKEWVIIDSTLYKSDEIISPYLYQAQYDSLMKIQQVNVDSAKAEMERNPGTIIDYFPPVPELYAELDDGTQLDLKEYGKTIKPMIPDELKCVIELTTKWDGTISQIVLNRCKPHLNYDIDLKKYLLNLRVRPAKIDGIPLPGDRKMAWFLSGK
ncbi:MAG: hypothetical protein JXR20_10670 [Balneola sp.]